VEWLKVEALSSNPSTTKKKKDKRKVPQADEEPLNPNQSSEKHPSSSKGTWSWQGTTGGKYGFAESGTQKKHPQIA
jgi:hypothetical protein